jgi:hypothetical protein
MATPIKGIEKNFFLKVLYDEQIPVIYLKDQTEYTLTLEKAPKEELYFRSNSIISGLRAKRKMGLMFNYWGRVISFSSEIISFRDDHIVVAAPEAIYRYTTIIPMGYREREGSGGGNVEFQDALEKNIFEKEENG